MMPVFYLVDPVARTVEKVGDGFDRAADILGAEEHDLTTLWTHSFDPDSSVDILVADEAALDEPWSEFFFNFRFTCGGETSDRIFAGKGIVGAGGEIPEDIAEQLRTLEAISGAVSFLTQRAAYAWRAEHAGEASTDRSVVHLHEHLKERAGASAGRVRVQRAAVSPDQNPKTPARRGQK